jgi:hypothetical protein
MDSDTTSTKGVPMGFHLYCMAYPIEALVASTLSPEEFGVYMAVGSKKSSRGKVAFLEVDANLKSDAFNVDRARQACAPQPAIQRRRNQGAHIDTVSIDKLLIVRKLRLPRLDSRQPYPIGAVFVLGPVKHRDSLPHHDELSV